VGIGAVPRREQRCDDLPRPVEARLDGADGRFGDVGDLLVRHVIPVAQDDHQPILRWQGIEDASHLAAPLGGFEALLGAGAVVGHPPPPHDVLHGQAALVSAAQAIDAVVRGDRQDPGGELAGGVIGVDARVDPQEGLLRGILGFGSTAQHAIGQVVDGRLVRRHQLGEGILVAPPGLCHPQALLIGSHPGTASRVALFPFLIIRLYVGRDKTVAAR